MSDSSKPGHVLEIPASLGRDIDRGLVPPVEAFMSDDALAEVERSTAAASAPVHAEDLTPISAAEARTRTTFDGEHMISAPATRRVIPAPFRRPRSVGGRHGKTWQSVPAGQVRPGDMTELVGVVASVSEQVRRETVAGHEGVATGTEVVLAGIGGVTARVDAAGQVRVFRAP